MTCEKLITFQEDNYLRSKTLKCFKHFDSNPEILCVFLFFLYKELLNLILILIQIIKNIYYDTGGGLLAKSYPTLCNPMDILAG